MTRFSYDPDANGAIAALALTRHDRVLAVGCEDFAVPAGVELRTTDQPPAPLINGTYIFPGNDGTDVMVVACGQRPGAPSSVDVHGPEDHPIHLALKWFDYLWDSGDTKSGGPQFSIGEVVVLDGSEVMVTVQDVTRTSGINYYRVVTPDGLRNVTEEGLRPLEIDHSDPRTWLNAPVSSANRFATGLTVTKLANPLTDTIYSYQSSKTVLRPYQFKPILRLLNSPHQRLLIADEVGLGKTIEAGLIWSELEARHQGLDRVLIICPATLTLKWQSEMRSRFDRRVPILDKAGLNDLVDAFRAGDPETKTTGIVSLERFRRAEALRELNDLQPRFDLIIVDEAHYLRNRSSLNYQMGSLLSGWADVLVFLSATPLNLGNDDLFNLVNLLVAEEFSDRSGFRRQVEPNRYINKAASVLRTDPSATSAVWETLQGIHDCELGSTVTGRLEWGQVEKLCALDRQLDWAEVAELKRLLQELNTLSGVLTRTRKADVADAKAIRTPVDVEVEWTDSEAALYLAVRRWANDRILRAGGSPGFASQMTLRQAASCLPGVVELINDKDPGAIQAARMDLDDLPDEPETGDDPDIESLNLTQQLVLAARAIEGVDSKFDGFSEFLVKQLPPGQQVLLFSYFRRTLGYLEQRLTTLGYSCRVLHGGVADMADRQKIMNQFRDGEFQFLLCSEVGSEGLDFEFCDTIVNYDLPWNPMRVEQRIGRLDRFGQRSDRIHILNFQVPGTIETDIFERLYRRIRVFEESIGDLEPILREELSRITKVALDPNLSEVERQQQADAIAIALEDRRHQLDDIAEASEHLAGLDGLLIDGFERDTTSRGRFVGPKELAALLEVFFAEVGDGTITRSHQERERSEVLGGDRLADAVATHARNSSGSRYQLAELVAMIRDGHPLEVTFSNEDASRTGVELMSLRHPVVRAAVGYLQRSGGDAFRLSSVAIDGLPDPDHTYLCVLHLASTSGLRPSLELWPVAMDLETGEFVEDAGFAVLAAIARHELDDGAPPDPLELAQPLELVLAEARRIQSVRETQRRADNESLVDARIATRRSSIEHRIARARGLLDQARSDQRDKRIVRLHEGTIRNATEQLRQVADDMAERRGLALTLQEIAVVVMTGRAQ